MVKGVCVCACVCVCVCVCACAWCVCVCVCVCRVEVGNTQLRNGEMYNNARVATAIVVHMYTLRNAVFPVQVPGWD